MKYKSFSKIPEDKLLYIPSMWMQDGKIIHVCVYEFYKDGISYDEDEKAYYLETENGDDEEKTEKELISMINYYGNTNPTYLMFDLTQIETSLAEARKKLIIEILK